MPNASTVYEQPLVLDGAQVRALLDGTKTQHRVPVSHACSWIDGRHSDAPTWDSLDLAKAWVDRGPSPAGNPGPYLKAPHLPDGRVHVVVTEGVHEPADCVHRLYSRVLVGDRLWVREAWAAFLPCGLRKKYYRTGVMKHEPLGNTVGRVVEVVYRADGEDVTRPHPNNATAKWSSARRMPQWASRLTLEVTELRAQRVQEITEDDAIAEGVSCYVCGRVLDGRGEAECHCYHRTARPIDIREHWDSRHYQHGLGWETNPWAWVYTFRRVES